VAAELDSAAAWEAHDPAEVVFTVDGSDVTWEEFFYFLNAMSYSAVQSFNSSQTAFSWDNTFGETTLSDYVWEEVVATCVQYHVMDAHLTELGVTLTAEDQETLKQRLADEMVQFAGEDATEADFEQVLADMYMTRDVYDYINRVSLLYERGFDAQFGKNGERLSDEDIAAYVEDNEYITAKHILIKTVDENDEPLEGQDLAEKTARATLVREQLREVEGDRDALLTKFDELMAGYSEDPGTQYYPDGYTFRPGEMVDEFQAAAEALGDYELSEPVQSQFGDHIILRLPTTRDSVVDFVDGVNDSTIGSYAANDAFGKLVGSWTDEAEIVWSDGFRDATAKTIFE